MSKKTAHLNAETALTAISRQKQTKLNNKKMLFWVLKKKERKILKIDKRKNKTERNSGTYIYGSKENEESDLSSIHQKYLSAQTYF